MGWWVSGWVSVAAALDVTTYRGAVT
jgi:hypothetical protein